MNGTLYEKICTGDTAHGCIKRYAISYDYGKRDGERCRRYPADAELRQLTIEPCEVEILDGDPTRSRSIVSARGALSLKILEDI